MSQLSMFAHNVHDLTGADAIKAGATYSADKIGSEQPVKKPYSFNGALWISTGGGSEGGVATSQMYRLVELPDFDGPTHTYYECDWDTMRGHELGGYHGMRVRLEKRMVVMVGPPLILTDPRTHAQLVADWKAEANRADAAEAIEPEYANDWFDGMDEEDAGEEAA